MLPCATDVALDDLARAPAYQMHPKMDARHFSDKPETLSPSWS